MNIILSISDGDKHFDKAIKEYTKRLSKSIDIINIKPFRSDNTQLIIRQETNTIIDIISKKYSKYYKLLLSKDGSVINTLDFTKILNKNIFNQKILFIIGGPYGLEEELLLNFIDEKISFGKITLPHGLAKLTLLEQIYRSNTIVSGKKYHY